ncbi:hypothetical protein TYRP_019149 [Tyrophagus putrescentiae]|nr:hypothetical protein TYRP_019149 [Tyrophagus putrescentiae]
MTMKVAEGWLSRKEPTKRDSSTMGVTSTRFFQLLKMAASERISSLRCSCAPRQSLTGTECLLHNGSNALSGCPRFRRHQPVGGLQQLHRLHQLTAIAPITLQIVDRHQRRVHLRGRVGAHSRQLVAKENVQEAHGIAQIGTAQRHQRAEDVRHQEKRLQDLLSLWAGSQKGHKDLGEGLQQGVGNDADQPRPQPGRQLVAVKELHEDGILLQFFADHALIRLQLHHQLHRFFRKQPCGTFLLPFTYPLAQCGQLLHRQWTASPATSRTICSSCSGAIELRNGQSGVFSASIAATLTSSPTLPCLVMVWSSRARISQSATSCRRGSSTSPIKRPTSRTTAPTTSATVSERRSSLPKVARRKASASRTKSFASGRSTSSAISTVDLATVLTAKAASCRLNTPSSAFRKGS